MPAAREAHRKVGQPGQQFVKVDHDVGLRLSDAFVDVFDAAHVFRNPVQVVKDTSWNIHPFGTGRGQEVGTYEFFDGGMDTADEKAGQAP